MKKQIANIVTGSRIFGSILLLFVPAFSVEFYIIYILWGCISKKQYISPHTIMNKITGFLLFLMPLTLSLVELKYSAIVVCSVATFAAIQEGGYIVGITKNEL